MHHENIKLMLNEINIQHLTEDNDMSLNNYRDCLDSIACLESSSSCFLGECEMYTNFSKLFKLIMSIIRRVYYSP